MAKGRPKGRKNGTLKAKLKSKSENYQPPDEKGPRQRGRPRSSQAKEKLALTPDASDKEKAPRQRGRPPRSSKANEKLELTPETSDKKKPAKKRGRPCSLQKHSSAQEITEEDIIPKKRRRSSRTKSKTQKPNQVQYVDCDLISNEENEQDNHEAYCPSESDMEERTKLFSENDDTEKDSIFDPLTTKLIPVVEKPAPLPTEIVEECNPAVTKYELKEEVEEILDCQSSVEIEGLDINPPHDWSQVVDNTNNEEPISAKKDGFCNSNALLEGTAVHRDLETFQIINNALLVRDNTNNEETISAEKVGFCNSNALLEGPAVHRDLETFQIINNALLMTGSIEEYVAENVSEHGVSDMEKSPEMINGFEECVAENVSELGAFDVKESPVLPQEVSNIKITNEVNKPKPTPKSNIYSTTKGFSEVNVTFTHVYPMLSKLNTITFENILQVIKERYQNYLHPTGVLEDSVFQSMYTDVFQSSDGEEQKHKNLNKLVYGMTLCARIQNKDPTISSLDSYFSMEKIYVILESIKEMCESFEVADCNFSAVEGLLWFFNTAGAKLIRENLSKCCGEEEKSSKIRNINIVLAVVNSNWKNLMKGNTQGSLHSTTVPVEDSDYITCDFITPHPESKKSHNSFHKSNNGDSDMKNNILKDLLQTDLSVKLAQERGSSKVINNEENDSTVTNNSEATNSNTDQPNNTFSNGTVIIQKKQSGDQIMKRKLNCCFYCKKMVCNVSRHVVTVHQNEKDVIPIMKLCKKRQKSKEELEEYYGRLRELRLKGNHLYTQQLLENNPKSQGSNANSHLIRNCSRFSNGPKKLKDIVMCTFCQGVYAKTTFHKHLKKCFTKKKLESTENQNDQLNKAKHGGKVLQKNRILSCFYCKQKVFKLLPHLLVEHQDKKPVIRYKALLKENSIESKRKGRKIIQLLHHKSRKAFTTKCTQNMSKYVQIKPHIKTRINKELSKENEEARDLEAQTIHNTNKHSHQINQKDNNSSIVVSEDKLSTDSPVSDRKLETEQIIGGSNLSQENRRYSLANETVVNIHRDNVIGEKHSIGNGRFNKKLFGVDLELNEEESLIDDDFTCMLRKDPLTKIALNDTLFIKVVQTYQRKNLKKKSKVFVQNILKKVKLGCKFLVNLKERDSSMKTLSNCFLPQKKELIFETIKEMCEVNETTGRIGLASIAPKLLIFMRDVTSQALKYTELNKSASDKEKITGSGLILSQSSGEILNFIEKICILSKLQKKTNDDSSSVFTPNIMMFDRGTFSKISPDRNDAVETSSMHNSYRSGDPNIMDGKRLSDINYSEIKYHSFLGNHHQPGTSGTSVFKRQKNCCLYCKKLVTHLYPHLTSRHKNSKEVIELNNLRKDTKDYKEQRRGILGELRRKGNHILNQKLLADLKSKGSHNLTSNLFRICRRVKSGPKELKNFLLCRFCKGVYSKNRFYFHLKSCFSKKKYDSENKQKISESENYPYLSVNESLGTPFKNSLHSGIKMIDNDLPLVNRNDQNEVKCVNKVSVDAEEGLLYKKRRQYSHKKTTFTTKKHKKIGQYGKEGHPNNVIFNRKKFYCFFCNKFVLKFTKHVLIRHKDKQPAIQYMNLLKENSDESKIEKRNIMRLLQMKSNSAYVKKCSQNIWSMKMKQRTSVVDEDGKVANREEKQNSNIRTKTVDQDTSTLKKERNVTRNFILKKYAFPLCPSLDPHPLTSIKLRELIVPRLKRDSASTIALNDALLMATASSVMERFQIKSKDRGFSATTNLIRDGGKLLLCAQSVDKTITEFRDLLKPSKVNTVFEATKEMCGLDEKTGSLKFITTPFRITYALNQAVAQVLEEAVNDPSLSENDKKSIKTDLDEFLNMKRIKFRSIITRWPASKKSRNISNFSESDNEILYDTSTNSKKNSVIKNCSNSGINSTTQRKRFSSTEFEKNSCEESDGDHKPTLKHKMKSKMSHKRASIPNTSCSNYIPEGSPIQKKRWTDKQKNIVIHAFKEFIINGTNPGRRRCRELIASSEELAERTADQVNLLIDNINKRKLKLPNEFQYLRRHRDD